MPAARARLDEIEVDPVVEEELGDQERGSGVDLGLQVAEVGLEVGRLRVDLGEAGASDREVPAAGDELGEVGGASQPALGLDEVVLTARWVPAQREDVLDPRVGDPVERRPEPLGGLADAAQVRHRFEAELVLQALRDLDRPIAGRAAGAVGHRDEVGPQLLQRSRRLEQLLGRLLGLRREELDRENRRFGLDDLVDAHQIRVGEAAPRAWERRRRRRSLGCLGAPRVQPVGHSAGDPTFFRSLRGRRLTGLESPRRAR